MALVIGAPLLAATDDDPLGPPTEQGIRFTPEMAREMGKTLAKELVFSRYQVPEDRKGEVGEMMAQRLMELAHKSGPDAQAFTESMVAQALEMQNNRGAGQPSNPTSEMGRVFGPQILNMIPHFREFFRGVGQDLRHVLPIKQQFKLAGDMLQIGTAMDAFEKNAQRWAKGEITSMKDPFQDMEQQPKLEADGQSKELKNARRMAEQSVNQTAILDGWERYVKQACELYGLDESQTTSAQSLLREYTTQAQEIIRDGDWRERAYRNRVWAEMLNRLHIPWHHPLRSILNNEYEQMSHPIQGLDNELKQKINQIPTQAQRNMAEQRILKALSEKGYEVE